MINSRRLWTGLIRLLLPVVALNANGTPAENASQPYVTCQLAEDGVTDDGPAINAYLKAHPCRHIMLRKTGAASYGGGQATSKDIYSSQTLTIVGDAQWLDCDVPSLWAGGCRIDFSPTLKGPGIEVPPEAQGVEISNLELDGGNCWIPTDLTTYSLSSRINGLGNDGILLAGGKPKLVNIQANCFKRYGISVLGDSSAYDYRTYGYSQPDVVRFERVSVDHNKGYGVFVTGLDSNAGLITFADARANSIATRLAFKKGILVAGRRAARHVRLYCFPRGWWYAARGWPMVLDSLGRHAPFTLEEVRVLVGLVAACVFFLATLISPDRRAARKSSSTLTWHPPPDYCARRPR